MYPINICMKGCQAAVFGGGAVALRKLGRLLDEEAKVVLVAPELVWYSRLQIAGRQIMRLARWLMVMGLW